MKPVKQLWWKAPDGDCHNYINEYVHRLVEEQNYRHGLNLQNFRLYNDEEVGSLGLSGYSSPSSGINKRHKVTFNIIQSMVDAATSEITSNLPTCTFLTSGGSWNQQRRSQLLDKFCKGLFYESKIYEVAPKVFTDACVFGTGVMKIYKEDSEIRVERIFPDEIVADSNESRYALPRQIFQLKVINKEVLLHLYPEKALAIEAAAVSDTERSYNGRIEKREEEQLMVCEAWHLPSGKEADDGRHSIVIEGATLLDESYDFPYFPFVFLNWKDRLLGFWGQGLAEMLTGIQVEINQLLRTIQEAMNLAKPKLLIEKGSQIPKGQINNELLGIIEYIGQKPQIYAPKPIAGEWFSHLDRLFERSYEIAGISEMAARSKKPVGLESAVALREFSDVQTRRFYGVASRYETLFVNAAKQMIDLARRAEEEGETFSTVSHGDKYIEQIRWKDINLGEESYVMKITPTNLLPDTPAGQLEFAKELIQSGLIQDPLVAVRMLQFPDIESVTSQMTASSDIVDMYIGDMLEKGRYASPEPFMDLTLTLQKTQNAYLLAKINGAPVERLELLVRYMQECMELLASMQAAASEAQAGQAVAEAGAGEVMGPPPPGAPMEPSLPAEGELPPPPEMGPPPAAPPMGPPPAAPPMGPPAMGPGA